MRGALKRILCFAAAGLCLLAAVVLIGSGFQKQGNACVTNFAVSEDGREIMLTVGVSTPIGYIRSVEIKQQQGGRCYLDAYAAFGGINGALGAKNVFTVPLAEDTAVIALYRAKNAYEPVLERAPDGTWHFTGRGEG